MFKNLVFLSITALLIISCGPQTSIPAMPTPTPPGVWGINVTENPVPEAPTQGAPSSGDECGNPYYPVVNGSQWNYIGTNGPFSYSLSSGTVGEFTIVVELGANTFNIVGLCMQGGDINLLEVPGDSLSYSGEAGSATTKTTRKEGVTLPGDIQVGDDWSQTLGLVVSAGNLKKEYTVDATYTAIGYESVTVPAGTFNALKIKQSSSMEVPTP